MASAREAKQSWVRVAEGGTAKPKQFGGVVTIVRTKNREAQTRLCQHRRRGVMQTAPGMTDEWLH